ncbi:hypothetical protein [Corynebacterium sp.]|uniref:hypothetical protein n=1 Tax=Corynebacterium sp. TaxID=1720 RepID=UPI0026DFA1BE|nr:hypothetical protein [Corynebacterium sp.]MDO5511416.1 hypothetical protein [Corynebacterium sp.]
MAVSLSIDLSNATFADLRALVDAARTAGVTDTAQVQLEDTTLLITSDDTAKRSEACDTPTPRNEHPPRGPFGPGNWPGQGGQIGDAAIRSVIDILTGRQEPPRRNE